MEVNQPMPRTIIYDIPEGERMILHDNGQIERPARRLAPSSGWVITGAVTLNNLGHEIRLYTLAEILANPAAIPWKHANGAQKTRLLDVDGGTARMWGNPGHHVE